MATFSFFEVSVLLLISFLAVLVDWLILVTLESVVWLEFSFTFELLVIFGILVLCALAESLVDDQCYQL